MSTKREQLTIDLDLIKEPRIKLRDVDTDSTYFKGIVDTLREDGLLNPINVERYVKYNEEDPEKIDFEGFRIVDGMHRVYGARELGWTTIEALVGEQTDEETLLIRSMLANLARVETKPAEYARGIKALLDANQNWTENQLATRLGCPASFIKQRLKLNKLAESLKGKLDNDEMTLSKAQALAELPEAEQIELFGTSEGEDNDAFLARVSDRKREIQQALREQKSNEPVVFEPVARLRKIVDVKTAMDTPAEIGTICAAAGASSPQEGAIAALAWILNLDKESVEGQKADWDKREEDKKAKAAARTAGNAAKKEAKLQKELDEIRAAKAAAADAEG